MGNSGGRTVVGVLRGDGAVGFTVQSSTNRYTSIGGNSISHDDAGNLTVDKDGYKYFYDYENRVVRIQKPDGLGGWDDVAQMAYDTLGRRIRVIDSVASTTTLYYYNPEWQCLAEYSGAGTLQRYFVYGNYIDEPLVMHRQSDGEDYYYGQDHLYSTAVLLDDSGNVAERYEYDAYGTVLVYTEDGDDNDWFDGDETTATASAKGNPYTFTGRRLDTLDNATLHHMHYRHRDYNTQLGRFVQHDLYGMFPCNIYYTFEPAAQYYDNVNLYQYVSSRPVVYLDPSGLRSPIFGAGKVCVDVKCSPEEVDYKYLPEDDWYTDCGEPDWRDVPKPGECAETDGIAGPGGGILKIPDNCTCTIRCNNDGTPKDVACRCLGGRLPGSPRPRLNPPGFPPSPFPSPTIDDSHQNEGGQRK